MEIKVCGMREPGNIRKLLTEVKPDWMGLIFYPPSSRFVADDAAAEIRDFPVRKVGVFVNENEEVILDKIKKFDLKAIQLHGNESPEFVRNLFEKTSCELWKVVSVKGEVHWEDLRGYLPYVTKFLFDTATSGHGGSGQQFDWGILETYPFEKGFLLSGGLDESSPKSIKELKVKVPQLEGVDLNSKFELSPGLKDIEKLKKFKKELFQN
ncbi:phosphoribosylanthranilate isomerase [Algoriphagus sp. CAU 1675]|uniref:phosphoribosylanthranilate isomerase n=1 Tax=Algoriphagus sp. CAU 1675 TaxID=3032597 RepID=UPI0023DB8193|nr:phosphoribosylanthranilate isomerase [Algoriphagus sp. CAU 1675]MDF2157385.1 phosphoribosylanthranilate isomerase [Algoriphagus sp. CAU 1675]